MDNPGFRMSSEENAVTFCMYFRGEPLDEYVTLVPHVVREQSYVAVKTDRRIFGPANELNFPSVYVMVTPRIRDDDMLSNRVHA